MTVLYIDDNGHLVILTGVTMVEVIDGSVCLTRGHNDPIMGFELAQGSGPLDIAYEFDQPGGYIVNLCRFCEGWE